MFMKQKRWQKVHLFQLFIFEFSYSFICGEKKGDGGLGANQQTVLQSKILWFIFSRNCFHEEFAPILTFDHLALIGTLEGFSFDSEDEAEKIPKAIPHQTDQNEDIDGQMNGKSKGRADKTSVCILTIFTKLHLCQFDKKRMLLLFIARISVCLYTIREVLLQMVSRKRGKTGGGKSQPAKKARKKAISKKPKAKK